MAQNVRLDRSRGVITSRPGMTALSSALGGAITRLTKLFGAAADYGYAQIGSALYRLTSAWATPTLISNALTGTLSETNFLDGYTKPWKFLASGSGPLGKDDGSTLRLFGIAPPAAAPASATLGTRGRWVIWNCDATTQTLGTNVGAYGLDATIKQEGANSVTFTVAADTLGSINTLVSSTHVAGTGTHTGAMGASSLTDGVFTFTSANILRGSLITNVTTGFSGTVTRITTHQVFFDGGIPGVFNIGDTWLALWNLQSFQVTQGSATGTATGGSTTTLVDTTMDFVRQGVTAGMSLWNTTTGAVGTITSIGQTTNSHDTVHVTAGMLGGSSATNAAGHTYRVINSLGQGDDWAHLQVRFDYPDRVEYLQVDFDLDGAGYNTNFYSVRVGQDRFNQGAGQWTELFLRKSEFQRFGPSTADWSWVQSMRVRVQTNSTAGGVTCWIDDISLVGGYGLEGELRYTAIYANETTGGMSAPAKTEDEVVFYTTAVTAARHPVTLSLSNIMTPSDPQVTHLWIYRQSPSLPEATFVATVPINTASFTDDRADVQLDNAKVLEPDNDPPPSTGTVVFGPGALQRLFMIHSRNKVRFSKAWELHKSRAENWPLTYEFQIGDGSQEALNGLVQDQTLFVFTEDATWEVLGQGPDAFVPLQVPLSRGLAAPLGLTYGDGQIFKVCLDGIYQQRGLTEQKLTGDIDPFFQGRTIHGLAPIGTLSGCRLQWYPHPTGNQVVLLYTATSGAAGRLILKKNPQSGQYTDCFFDDGPVAMSEVYSDPQTLTLLYGSNEGVTGRVYQGEVESVSSDGGSAIVGRLRTPAYDEGRPRLVKTYSDLLFDVNTGGTSLTVTASFDRSTTTVSAGTVSSSADQSMSQLTLAQTTTPAALRRHNLALDLTWSATTQVILHQLAYHWMPEAEDLTFLDTGPVVFDPRALCRRLHFDGDLPAPVTGTLRIDGVAGTPFTLSATTGRQRVDQLISTALEAGYLRGKIFRLTLSSASPFLLYSALGEFEQEPLPITLFDSRALVFPTPQILRHLLFDLEAPGAVTLTVQVDGTSFLTTTVGPTSGRQRFDSLVTTAVASAHGRAFQVGLASGGAFQLWGLTGLFEAEPLPTTFWDSRELPSVLVQAVKWVAFDLDAPAVMTVNTYLDGTLRDTRTLGPTVGRQRVNHLLPAGLKGRSLRLTATASQPFQLWQVQPMQKAWGRQMGYTPGTALAAFTGMQQESVLARVEQQRVERALVQAGG